MRADEELAKDIFSQYLRQCVGISISTAPGADPPDFDAIIGGQAFPLEITTISEQIAAGGDSRSEVGWMSSIQRWVARVEERALSQGFLSGRYFLRAAPIEDFRSAGPSVQERLFDYLKQTCVDPTAEEVEIWEGKDPHRSWTIRKVGAGADRLLLKFAISGALYEGPAEAKLEVLLQDRMRDKADKMPGIRNVILVLIDNLRAATSESWAVALSRVGEHPFHTIARVGHSSLCQVVASREQSWEGEAVVRQQ